MTPRHIETILFVFKQTVFTKRASCTWSTDLSYNRWQIRRSFFKNIKIYYSSSTYITFNRLLHQNTKRHHKTALSIRDGKNLQTKERSVGFRKVFFLHKIVPTLFLSFFRLESKMYQRCGINLPTGHPCPSLGLRAPCTTWQRTRRASGSPGRSGRTRASRSCRSGSWSARWRWSAVLESWKDFDQALAKE